MTPLITDVEIESPRSLRGSPAADAGRRMDIAPARPGDALAAEYRQAREQHWDRIAEQVDTRYRSGAHYHRRLREVYGFLVPPGQRVLELGCGTGDLLAALEPSRGVGIDFSREMLRRAATRHPDLHFVHADAHELNVEGPFDVVVLSDLLNDVWDVQTVLQRVRQVCHARTRIIFNFYSRVWEAPLKSAARLGLAKPTLQQNWLTVADMANLLRLAGFEVLRNWYEVLLPLPIPLVDKLCNRFLVKLWPLHYLALTNFMIATPRPQRPRLEKEPVVSVVVACRNEEGNIPEIFARVPELGGGTELIFVEGNSTDQTYAAIERAIAQHPERNCKLFRQPARARATPSARALPKPRATC